jgi:hypothetical protein
MHSPAVHALTMHGTHRRGVSGATGRGARFGAGARGATFGADPTRGVLRVANVRARATPGSAAVGRGTALAAIPRMSGEGPATLGRAGAFPGTTYGRVRFAMIGTRPPLTMWRGRPGAKISRAGQKTYGIMTPKPMAAATPLRQIHEGGAGPQPT